MAVFYIYYFNNMIKFVRSFKTIMETSKIDDSDIAMIEVYITLVLGLILLIYGGVYAYNWHGEKAPKGLGKG